MPDNSKTVVKKLHDLVNDLAPLIESDADPEDAEVRITLIPDRKKRTLMLSVFIHYR